MNEVQKREKKRRKRKDEVKASKLGAILEEDAKSEQSSVHNKINQTENDLENNGQESHE